MTIYLEYKEGSSSKFWAAKVSGSDLVIRYGKIGTDGREVVKSQTDESSAQAAMEKEANKKRKKGYLDVSQNDESADASETAQKAVRSLKQFANTFSGIDGATVTVQLLDVDSSLEMNDHGWVGGGGPTDATWPTDTFSNFDGIDATPEDARQTHLMTLSTEKLSVVGVPDGKALSVYTPVNDWLRAGSPVEVVTSDSLTPRDDVPGPAGSHERANAAHGLRVMEAVEVPTLAFAFTVLDFDEYSEMYAEESEELEGIDKEEREEILEDGELAAIYEWAGKRLKLTKAQCEAIDGIQSILKSTPYVGGSPLYIQQETSFENAEFNRFHLQFGEELGVNAGDCGQVYVGLKDSSWDCN